MSAVFEWAQQGLERGAALHVPAARCLTAVAGPDDRAEKPVSEEGMVLV